METGSDPREWLQEEQKQLEKLRNRTDRSQAKTNAAAIALWLLAAATALLLAAAVFVHVYRSR